MKAKAASLCLKKLLDNKRAAWVCCCVGIVSKSLTAFFYSDLSADKALYLLFTQNFLNTGILAEPVKIVETGKALPVYNPAVHSPLYSFLCAPFLWLTNSFFATQFIVSVLSWVLFFTALYQVATFLFKTNWHVSIFLFFAAFFLYCHELSSGPKDTLALGFTLWTVALIHRFLTTVPNWKTTCLLAVLLACMCLVKLLYIPLAASLFLVLFIFVTLKKSKVYFLQTGLLIGVFIGISLLTYCFVFLPAYHLAAPQALRLPVDDTPVIPGFYPHNLSVVFPFVSASFMDTTFLGVQIEKLTTMSFSGVMNAFRKIDILLLAAIIFLCLFYFRRLVQNRVLLLLTVPSFTMIVVVAYLSVTQKLFYYPHNLGMWSYGVDARSFLLPILTVQLATFLFLFHSARFVWAKAVLILVLLFAFVHGLYFVARTTLTSSRTPESNANTGTFKKVSALLFADSIPSTKQSGLVTPNNALRRYAQVHALPVYSFSNLKAQAVWMKKGDRFLVAIYPEDPLYLKKFPSQKFVQLNAVPPFALYQYTAE